MSVSSKAEGEASQKGLTGERKRAYVGGAINRAKHEKAEAQPEDTLQPIKAQQYRHIDVEQGANTDFIKEFYGEHQMGAVLSRHSNDELSAEAERLGIKPGRTKAETISRITSRVTEGRYSAAFGRKSATPAARSKQQAHSYQREAVADARGQIRYHEAQIAGLREGLKLRRELAGPAKPKRTSDEAFADAVQRAVTKRENGSGFATFPQVREELRRETGLSDAAINNRLRKLRDEGDAGRAPITLHFELDEDRMHLARRGQLNWRGHDFDFISVLPSVQEQKRRDAESMQRMRRDEEAIFRAHGMTPPVRDLQTGKVLRHAQPTKPKRTPRPKAPPTIEQQIERAGGYVPKTPADKLRKLPVREMTDAQLMRDWENHPPERRRGVLEREMARRHAKAEKAQQPKAAKPSAKPAARAKAKVATLRPDERAYAASLHDASTDDLLRTVDALERSVAKGERDRAAGVDSFYSRELDSQRTGLRKYTAAARKRMNYVSHNRL